MGLEHLEIEFQFEETFQLEFGDDFWEAAFDVTSPGFDAHSQLPVGAVGRVYDELMRRLNQAGMCGSESSVWTSDSVWLATQSIIASALSVSPEQVVRTARLIQDLGMG